MTRSKQKGTSAETAVVRYLQANGFPHVERRALAGVNDKGDIAGVPGVVIEVKNCSRMDLSGWVREAETERDNAHAAVGVVWHKRRGKADPAHWFVTLTGSQFVELLRVKG